MRFKNKVVVITGGGGSVGSAAAGMFIREGARVVISGRSDQGRLKAEELSRLGPCRFIQADVTDPRLTELLMSQVAADFGRLDVLFTAAGIYEDAEAIDLSPDTWEKMLRINLSGTFHANKYALVHMLRQRQGVIVNSCSVFGLVGLPHLTAYSATMGGIRSLTQSLAATYSHRGIRINCVCPGAIDTPRLVALTGQSREELIEQHPAGRLGTPEEVARCVLFLASDRASFVSGAELVVDGAYRSK